MKCLEMFGSVNQLMWVGKVLERFGMEKAKSVTPVDTSTKLVKAVEDDEMFDRAVYQSAVGSLLYLSDRHEARYCFCSWERDSILF